jgi:uncharacterized membrane protein YedE/YeeE
MQDVDMGALAAQVLWAALALGVVFGAIAQRTHFCTMGAVSDVVNVGDWSRMRMWALAIGVAMLGFNGMVAAGWVDPAKSFYAAARLNWLSALAGGALFGVGMVLASGCGSKTLVRIGGGNLKAVVVFLVLALAAFATLRGITGVARVATVDRVYIEFAGSTDLPSMVARALGVSRAAAALVLGAAIGGGLVLWSLARAEGRQRDVLLGGLGIGAAVVAMWWVSGRLGHVAEDPNTLQEAFVATNSQRMESLSFVAPVAYTVDCCCSSRTRTSCSRWASSPRRALSSARPSWHWRRAPSAGKALPASRTPPTIWWVPGSWAWVASPPWAARWDRACPACRRWLWAASSPSLASWPEPCWPCAGRPGDWSAACEPGID